MQEETIIETHIFEGAQHYLPLWDLQKSWVKEIDHRQRKDSLLLLEHEHVFTLGRSAKEEHLLISVERCQEQQIQLAEVDRGGDITYHGPGQLIGYPLIDLQRWKNDPHIYLRKLEETIIRTLQHFGLEAGRKPPYTGVWIKNQKIAAIGVKFNRRRTEKGFITSHGFALNVQPDLSMFKHIIPCGIKDYEVTSMRQCLGHDLRVEEVVEAYIPQFLAEFQYKV